MDINKISRKKAMALHLNQWDHIAKQLDARETRSKHILTRKRWLERQNNANYRNEYDRITGELSRTNLPVWDKLRLQQREEELKKLFSNGNI